jgi:hypothetical protein
VPSREPCCFSGGAGGVEIRGPAVHRVADLAPSGARAVGCFDGAGAPPTCVLSFGSQRPRWAAAKV